MKTRDVLQRSEATSQVKTREEAVAPWIDPKSWESLEDRFEVVIQAVGQDSSSGGTDLHQALQDARDKYLHLQGLVLLSDGDWNAGLPPVQAAMRLRLDNIPIQAVPVGSSSRLPDIDC